VVQPQEGVERGRLCAGEDLFSDGEFPAATANAIMPLSEVPLKGAHNLENALAGISIGMLAGCQTGADPGGVRNLRQWSTDSNS